jgi:DNA-binding NarL/FixJ family response regulator
MIRVLLVDDQPLVRAGLRLILEPQDDITIMGECDDGDQVLAAVDRDRPDVVVMDVRMRRMDGAEATSQLRSRAGSPPVLILTTFDDDETVAAALGAGAAGFILKDARGEDIVRATTTVAEGGSGLGPQIAGQVLDAYRRSPGARSRPHRPARPARPVRRHPLRPSSGACLDLSTVCGCSALPRTGEPHVRPFDPSTKPAHNPRHSEHREG